ncbi:MAG TPA: response regulator [Acidobacteria bacterium]|nr:response regulator [Acidobacteriota bacterium]
MAAEGRARVLVIDDEQSVREMISEGLTSLGWEVATAADAEQARRLVARGVFECAICDIAMPGEQGTELLEWMRRYDPLLAVVMLTGLRDAPTAVAAMRAGASDYVCKPFSLPEMDARLREALDKRRLRIENQRYREHLEELVEARTRKVLEAMEEIATLNRELTRAYDNTLSALMIALEHRDNETQGHSLRVVAYTDRLAREMGIRDPELTEIKRGAMLHDVGKIGVRDAVLRKPGPLDPEEIEQMHQHPRWGWEMLRGIEFLAVPAEIVLSHQENWDGSGYPRGLQREEIPIGARIFAVADTLDAMTSHRPYRNAGTMEQVRGELLRCAGSQFDPRVVEAFLAVEPEEWWALRAAVQRAMGAREDAGIPPGLFSLGR